MPKTQKPPLNFTLMLKTLTLPRGDAVPVNVQPDAAPEIAPELVTLTAVDWADRRCGRPGVAASRRYQARRLVVFLLICGRI